MAAQVSDQQEVKVAEAANDIEQYSIMGEGKAKSLISQISEAASFVVKKPPFWVLAVVVVGYFVSGVCQSLSTKLQNRVLSEPGPGRDPVYFSNPFWQTMVMFMAEALCYPLYYLDEWNKKRRNKRLGFYEFPNSLESFNKPPSPWYLWIVPAVTDLIGVAAANWALSLTYASTVSLIRNSSSMWTAIGTLVILRKPLRVHQWIGVALATGGMIATAIWAMANPDQNVNNTDLAWVGILAALVSVWMSALHMVIEEHFFRYGYMPPLKGVGIQGVTGIPMNIIAIIIVHYAGWFSISDSWYQFTRSGVLVGGNLWYFFVTTIANATGLAITKLTTSLVRSVLFACRSPVVWVVEMIIGWSEYHPSNLIALILIFIGFFVFILLLPGISKKRTPKVYRGLRKDIPCFCTHPLPQSDDEESPDKEKISAADLTTAGPEPDSLSGVGK